MVSNKAPVSVCLIVKNEELQIENCLKSIREHVEEIIVVDTGSTDRTPMIVQQYADKFLQYTDCNDESGRIVSFSMARNKSFSLASQPWILWIDGDDEVRGAENLNKLIASVNAARNGKPCYVAFPYEYSHDEQGNVNLLHYRERLISPPGSFQWINSVHEVLVPLNHQEVYAEQSDEVVIVHHRGSKKMEANRNLRILETTYEKEKGSDARTLYYIGLEYGNAGQIDKAIEFLLKYIDASGWDDEKYMACLKLTEHYMNRGNYQLAMDINLRALTIKQNWCEGYLNISKCFYFIAQDSKKQNDWEKCIYFAELGLSLPPTQTMLFVNPLEREFEIHKFLNIAYNAVGRVNDALGSVKAGLGKRQDPSLEENKKIYENFLSRSAIVEGINSLKNNGSLPEPDRLLINGLIHGEKPANNYSAYVKSPTYPRGIQSDHFPTAVLTPHAQAWGMPDSFEFDDLPVKTTDNQLQATVLMIWKEYMLHDEIVQAINFLENAPYRVKHTAATEKALRITRETIAWITNTDKAQQYNSPADPNVETGSSLPEPLVAQAGGRYDWVSERMDKDDKHIDFGCFDGAMTNRWGMAGFNMTGIDLCETSIELARKKAEEFNTGAEYICSYFQDVEKKLPVGSFDCAVSCDTYEHLLDPVADLLVPARNLLKKSGRFLLVTPHGSWLRGVYLPWAHPWRWAQDMNKPWICDEPRAHVVAPTVWTVADNFKKAGYRVQNSYVVLCEGVQDVADQGNVCVEASIEKQTKQDKLLDIVFFGGDAPEAYTPESFKKTGLGGSETMLIEMSRRLAALGHKVRVYAGVGVHGEGIYDQVEWRQTNKYQDICCDVLIVSRRADMIADKYNIKAGLKLLWVHDVCAINANNTLLLKYDRILALSEWHKQNLIDTHDLSPEHVIVTRNGIDLGLFDRDIKRDRYKCYNSSSPDRSWPVLLSVWSRIKEQVPEATLTLSYGFGNWLCAAQNDPLQLELIRSLQEQIVGMKDQGVIFLDRISQEKLAEEILSSGVLLYPTWFQETFFITGAAAQAGGARIVSSSIAAIKETVGERGVLLSGDWTSQAYQDEFVKEAVLAIQETNNHDREQLRQYARDNFCLDQLATDWNDIFYNLARELKENPIVPYRATREYL